MKTKNLQYGAIGNCRSAALVSEHGSIDWCCLPDFDSPSVFARLLDTSIGGHFAIRVSEAYSVRQQYIDRTNILCTTFESDTAAFEVIDFMPRYKTSENDYFTPAEVYRYLRPLKGTPQFAVDYKPALNYAQDLTSHTFEDNRVRSYSHQNPTDCVYLYSNFDLSSVIFGQELTLSEASFFLLSYNQKLIEIDLPRVYLEYQRTKVYWLNWINRAKRYETYNREIVRSLLVLKIMSYQNTGAILAALTTSLPETIGEVRNWDYRFCWLRDASMSIDTLLQMGQNTAAARFLTYIKTILQSKNDSFQIMYGIRGERKLTERELTHLSGYENSRPVRVGNAAYHQRQNDVFGYLLSVICQYYEHFPGTLDEIEDMWEIVRNIARSVVAQWELPDKGIWEIRNDDRHFVFSKVMCWVAMDRAAKIARLLNRPFYENNWTDIANDIKADVLKNGWNDTIQSFTQFYGSDEVDASLLLLAEYGFIDSHDKQYVSTVQAVYSQLYHKGLMYRYRNHDDFGTPSSSFTICTFWMVQALHRIGETTKAQHIFDQLLQCSNALGLFSEDIDFETKRLLGNFPQAYSHLALINTARMFSKESFISKFIKP